MNWGSEFTSFIPPVQSSKLEDIINDYVEQWKNIRVGKMMEILPYLIKWTNAPITLDTVKCEYYLRMGMNIAIGYNSVGELCLLGYIKTNLTPSNVELIYPVRDQLENNIFWVVPEFLRPAEPKEITHQNLEGNYIIIRNKDIMYASDMALIINYMIPLGECVRTRLSLLMQGKNNTFIVGEEGDIDIDKMVNTIYQGSPFPKIGIFFSPEEQIIELNGADKLSGLTEVKRAQENLLNEMYADLGLPVLGVDKESGVTTEEANSSDALTSSVGNVYIMSRQRPLDLLNHKWGFDIQVSYDNKEVEKACLGQSDYTTTLGQNS